MQQILWILNQFKGNKSCTIDTSLTKLNEHCPVMTIQNYCKFREIPFIGYLVMTQFVDFLSNSRAITHCRNWRDTDKMQYAPMYNGDTYLF